MATAKLSTDGPVPLVLFSGGLDSTYLLSVLLKTTDVDVLYVSGPQGKLKETHEIRARKKIVAWLNKNKPYSVRTQHHWELPNGVPGYAYRFGQVLPWFYSAMTVADGLKHTVVNIAYVMGDQVCQHFAEMTWAWDYMKEVCMSKPVPLRFPLKDTTKVQILNQLEPELLKLVWFCETPKKNKPCGECAACINHQVELMRLQLMRKRDEPKT